MATKPTTKPTGRKGSPRVNGEGSSTQSRHTALASQVTARSASLGSLQPEDITAAHHLLPPTSPPLLQVTSTVNPYFLLPPNASTVPPIMSRPVLDQKAFNAPTEQGPAEIPIDIEYPSSVDNKDRNCRISALELRIRGLVEEQNKMEEEKRKLEKELKKEEDEIFKGHLCRTVIMMEETINQHGIPTPAYGSPPRRKYSSVDGPQDVGDSARGKRTNIARGFNPHRPAPSSDTTAPPRRKYSSVDGPQDVGDSARGKRTNIARGFNPHRPAPSSDTTAPP